MNESAVTVVEKTGTGKIKAVLARFLPGKGSGDPDGDISIRKLKSPPTGEVITYEDFKDDYQHIFPTAVKKVRNALDGAEEIKLPKGQEVKLGARVYNYEISAQVQIKKKN